MKTNFETLATLAGRLCSEGETAQLKADLETFRAGRDPRELAQEFFDRAEEVSDYLLAILENPDERESHHEEIAELEGFEPVDLGDELDGLSLEVSVNTTLVEYFQTA